MRYFADWLPFLRRVVPVLGVVLALSLGACTKKTKLEEKADAQQVLDQAALQKYLAAQRLTGAVRTVSGAYYAVTTPGTGDKPTPTQLAKVDYRFYLIQGDTLDGRLVQSTYVTGIPAYLRPKQTIKGFSECLQLMSVGETGRMMIPSGLAYGTAVKYSDNQTDPIVLIPANANLIYYVTLLRVTD